MPRSLIKLAQEGTDEARRRLFAQVSELVIANLDERTDRELAIFSEVIIKLYSVGSPRDRARGQCFAHARGTVRRATVALRAGIRNQYARSA